jgi:hypothetical protein
MKLNFPNPFKKSKPKDTDPQSQPERHYSAQWIDDFNKLLEEGELLRVKSMISSKMIPEEIWNTPENIQRVSDILLSNIKNNEWSRLEDITEATEMFNIPKEILKSEEVIRWAIRLVHDKINKVAESISRPINISKDRNSLGATYEGLLEYNRKKKEAAIKLLLKVKKLFSFSNETFEAIGDKVLQEHSEDDAKSLEYWVKSMVEGINQKEN